MDEIAVLIPCYNEEQTIGKVVHDFKAELPEAVIYVYDNNSTDDTVNQADSAGAVVRFESEQGKGNVVRRMFREIDAKVYLLVDGDDTYDACNARQLVDGVLKQQADMVIGDRLSSTYFQENKRPFHNTGNRLVRWMINHLFHVRYTDILTGYRAFSYEFVKTFSVESRGFEIETEMSVHAADKHLNVQNVTVGYQDRPEGSVSKLNTVSDGIKVLVTILNLLMTYRPMWFFGLIALLFVGLGIGFCIPVVAVYNVTGLVRRFPTLIVCGFSMLTGIVSFFTGLILSVLHKQNIQSFELTYISQHDLFTQKLFLRK